jgi:class 3 adenylate cyclase
VASLLPAIAEPDDADGSIIATILFTDIVDSTRLAASLGDRAWCALLALHHAVIRRALRRFGGREVKTMGDGFVAVFELPTSAIRCAESVVHGLAAEALSVRAGIHTGECRWLEGDVVGIAVHTAARVAARASGGEVLVSVTVRDLVEGSELDFVSRGVHVLKGLPRAWHLFAVEPRRQEASRPEAPATTQLLLDRPSRDHYRPRRRQLQAKARLGGRSGSHRAMPTEDRQP